MPTYIIRNRIFSDEDVRQFEAKNDEEAIRLFKRRYPDYTDDGGWHLARAGEEPMVILASTEPDELEDHSVVSYLSYAT